jgi:hypothetical protein
VALREFIALCKAVGLSARHTDDTLLIARILPLAAALCAGSASGLHNSSDGCYKAVTGEHGKHAAQFEHKAS